MPVVKDRVCECEVSRDPRSLLDSFKTFDESRRLRMLQKGHVYVFVSRSLNVRARRYRRLSRESIVSAKLRSTKRRTAMMTPQTHSSDDLSVLASVQKQMVSVVVHISMANSHIEEYSVLELDSTTTTLHVWQDPWIYSSQLPCLDSASGSKNECLFCPK